MLRRIGEPWLPGRPYRDRPGAYAVAMRGGRVLCVWQDDELQLPGGGIDPGESPWQALRREVLEETGWVIHAPVRIAGFQRFAWLPDYGYWARKVQAVYLARAVRPLGPPSEPGHVPVWLTPREAAQRLMVTGDRMAVRGLIARRTI